MQELHNNCWFWESQKITTAFKVCCRQKRPSQKEMDEWQLIFEWQKQQLESAKQMKKVKHKFTYSKYEQAPFSGIVTAKMWKLETMGESRNAVTKYRNTGILKY